MKTKAKAPVRKPARRPRKVGRASTAELISPPFQPPAQWKRHFAALVALHDKLRARSTASRSAAAAGVMPFSADVLESASDEFDLDVMLTELSSEQNAIYEIEQALKRILNGTYGVCELTGKRIPAARLRAVPWTRFAKPSEETLESRGDAVPARLGELRSLQISGTSILEGSSSGDEAPGPTAEDENFHELPTAEEENAEQATPTPARTDKRRRR
jgi:RNA polymerase-binding transcription factor DksA